MSATANPGVPAFTVGVRWDCQQATVTVTGSLDLVSSGSLTEQLGAVAARRPRRLVLDLSEMTGARAGLQLIRVFCTLERSLSDGFPFVLRAPSPEVLMMLQAAGMDSLCQVEEP